MVWDWSGWAIPRDPIKAREALIEERLALFIKTENPLHAWEIIELCTRSDPIRFPEEVLEYLNITAISMLDVAKNKPKAAEKRIMKALGFKGERNVAFVNYHRLFLRAEVCMWLTHQVRVEKLSWNKAVAAAEKKFPATRSTINRWMNEVYPDRGKQRWPEFLASYFTLYVTGPI